MHGKATTDIQLEGNSPKEEQIAKRYLRDYCFAAQNTTLP